MATFDFKTVKYCVSNLSGFSFTEALRLWKTKFETIKHFKKDVITHNALHELGLYVEEVWNEIIPFTVQEALLQPNMEIRRTMFDCIGVARLFRELSPELLDKQVIKKVRTRWDEKYQPFEYKYNDTYELYKINGHKLFKQDNSFRSPDPVFAVRCWCTTTQREYWIYVPLTAAYQWTPGNLPHSTPDAISAIAWTIRINITHPKRIYRQGDIIVVQESIMSREVWPYHLTKDQYLELMYSET
jgi:hypothetical protein